MYMYLHVDVDGHLIEIKQGYMYMYITIPSYAVNSYKIPGIIYYKPNSPGAFNNIMTKMIHRSYKEVTDMTYTWAQYGKQIDLVFSAHTKPVFNFFC